ncbi:MAG: hypothetical protein N5P05_002801 [Chroococcopsis gigantea SAG 12.99]|jgi:hypothetical protein|nr:hypothetical protein [Chlorogloea purpurea SAG 13.99]MDV3001195.1 hypothetical protein [Chroococcopsis gigantea SAG 12.99]
MMSQAHWGILTVKQFFNGLYWSGETPPLADTPTVAETQENINWLNLSASEFFARANWRGLTLTKSVTPSTPKTISINSPVEEYFQFFPWQGQPAMKRATAPVKPESPPANARSAELNLEDLSSLF